jgi:hypothetical protein
MVATQVGLQFSGQVNGESVGNSHSGLTTTIAQTLMILHEIVETDGNTGSAITPFTDIAMIHQWKNGVPAARKVYLIESIEEKSMIVREWDVQSGYTNRVKWEPHPNFPQYGRVMLLGSPQI